jgi:hypothetical protein
MTHEIELKLQAYRLYAADEKSLIITNPPTANASRAMTSWTYKTIGERLKHAFEGKSAWCCRCATSVLTAGLKAPSDAIYNGELNASSAYEIFDGKYNLSQAGEV